MSGLHVAASRGSDWAAHILLKTGADPHARDSRGNTPLMLARARYGSDSQGRQSHLCTALYIFYRESRIEYLVWRTNYSTAHG